jgi:hypothetical protein
MKTFPEAPVSEGYDYFAEASRDALLTLMACLSEEHWCAGWLNGMEYDFWQAKPGTWLGMNKLTDRRAMLLRLLAEEGDCWWVWNKEEENPVAVPLKEWRDMVAAKSQDR